MYFPLCKARETASSTGKGLATARIVYVSYFFLTEAAIAMEIGKDQAFSRCVGALVMLSTHNVHVTLHSEAVQRQIYKLRANITNLQRIYKRHDGARFIC